MQAACSSETTVSSYKTTWRHSQDHNIYAKSLHTISVLLSTHYWRDQTKENRMYGRKEHATDQQ
jgi:hypothetical protein